KSLTTSLALVNAASLQVAMPRCKMTETFSLGGELARLGMMEAFHREKANFTGMCKDLSPTDAFFLSEVVHKAFVVVNEQGTEAAAATAGDMVVNDSAEVGAPIPFRADHPFLFLVRHNATGSILFLGRVSDPRDH